MTNSISKNNTKYLLKFLFLSIVSLISICITKLLKINKKIFNTFINTKFNVIKINKLPFKINLSYLLVIFIGVLCSVIIRLNNNYLILKRFKFRISNSYFDIL
jgi:hypothetical protein